MSAPLATRATQRARADWHPRFLEILRASCNVRLASAGAGVDHSTAYREKRADPEFAALWEAALEESIDALEGIAYQRASETSDDLAKFILKGRRRAIYGDRSEIAVNSRVHYVLDLGVDTDTRPDLADHGAAEEPADRTSG